MDNRSYAIGIGVGQSIRLLNLTKSDVKSYFRRQYKKENCNETCPFVGACDRVMALADDEQTLCDILGTSDE